jgi:hypothetical protein
MVIVFTDIRRGICGKGLGLTLLEVSTEVEINIETHSNCKSEKYW